MKEIDFVGMVVSFIGFVMLCMTTDVFVGASMFILLWGNNIIQARNFLRS